MDTQELKSSLQALCDRWEKEVYSNIPEAYTSRGLEEKYLRGDNWQSGMMDCVLDLRSLLEDV